MTNSHPNSRRKLGLWLVGFLMFLIIGGCIETTDVITIMPDGSGRGVIYTASEITQLFGQEDDSSEEFLRIVGYETVLSLAEKFKGVEAFTKPEIVQHRGKPHIKFSIYFNDINQVQLKRGKDDLTEDKYHFDAKNGVFKITSKSNKTELDKLKGDGDSFSFPPMLEPFLVGLYINQTYVLPGPVKEAPEFFRIEGRKVESITTYKDLKNSKNMEGYFKEGQKESVITFGPPTVGDKEKKEFKREMKKAVKKWKKLKPKLKKLVKKGKEEQEKRLTKSLKNKLFGQGPQLKAVLYDAKRNTPLKYFLTRFVLREAASPDRGGFEQMIKKWRIRTDKDGGFDLSDVDKKVKSLQKAGENGIRLYVELGNKKYPIDISKWHQKEDSIRIDLPLDLIRLDGTFVGEKGQRIENPTELFPEEMEPFIPRTIRRWRPPMSAYINEKGREFGSSQITSFGWDEKGRFYFFTHPNASVQFPKEFLYILQLKSEVKEIRVGEKDKKVDILTSRNPYCLYGNIKDSKTKEINPQFLSILPTNEKKSDFSNLYFIGKSTYAFCKDQPIEKEISIQTATGLKKGYKVNIKGPVTKHNFLFP